MHWAPGHRSSSSNTFRLFSLSTSSWQSFLYDPMSRSVLIPSPAAVAAVWFEHLWNKLSAEAQQLCKCNDLQHPGLNCTPASLPPGLQDQPVQRGKGRRRLLVCYTDCMMTANKFHSHSLTCKTWSDQLISPYIYIFLKAALPSCGWIPYNTMTYFYETEDQWNWSVNTFLAAQMKAIES